MFEFNPISSHGMLSGGVLECCNTKIYGVFSQPEKANCLFSLCSILQTDDTAERRSKLRDTPQLHHFPVITVR